MADYDDEIAKARAIIGNQGGDAAEFTFTLTHSPVVPGSAEAQPGHYAIMVERNRLMPRVYEGGQGKDWVALFERELGEGRFTAAGAA
jgi:hypothetical protein